jgi:hypothetical protein
MHVAQHAEKQGLKRAFLQSRRALGRQTGHIAALPDGAKKSLKDQARERNPNEEFHPWRGYRPRCARQGLPDRQSGQGN